MALYLAGRGGGGAGQQAIVKVGICKLQEYQEKTQL